MDQLDGALSAKEVSEILGVTPGRVRQFVHNGQLKGRKFGSLWVFSLADVQEFAKQDRPKVGRPKTKEETKHG